jgi:mono/diheme cytochrome c family protein
MANLKPVLPMAIAVWAIATLVTSAEQSKPATSAAAPATGVYSEAQAARGDAIYNENCAQCHTPTLAGGDLAPALTGQAFVARWTATKPLADLFDYMRAEMPLNSPGGLTTRQNADLLAFLLKRAGYPAGKIDLPNTTTQLADVRVAK